MNQLVINQDGIPKSTNSRCLKEAPPKQEKKKVCERNLFSQIWVLLSPQATVFSWMSKASLSAVAPSPTFLNQSSFNVSSAQAAANSHSHVPGAQYDQFTKLSE